MLLLFEDELWSNFVPLTYTRPVFDIRCGPFTLRERVEALLTHGHLPVTEQVSVPLNLLQSNTALPSPINIMRADQKIDDSVLDGLCRPYLMDCYGPKGGTNALLSRGEPLTLINGRALELSWLPRLLEAPIGTTYETEGQLLGARLSPALASVVLYYLRDQNARTALDELRRFGHVTDIDTPLITYPWDLIKQSGEQVLRDMPMLMARLPRFADATVDAQITARNPDHVCISPTARLDGPLVLDARDGPIFIDDKAHIEPFSFIQGPAYIGKNTLISSALVRGETSIGPVCRIGGEVEASIIQGFTNKHHEGFLGHSWLGEWVNIGAMTTTSDLKNTYGNIKVALENAGQLDSGTIKLGCFLADHVKLGIGLHLTGGAVIGTGSNLFGVHMLPKTVPPFTWGSEVFYEYRIDRMVSVAHRVMGRRKLVLTSEYEAMLRAAFVMTRTNRDPFTSVLQSVSLAEPGSDSMQLLTRAESEAERAYEPDQAMSSS
jgi:UDP-N-acetylglucosamine diphosphorylase/glucosamine-1-phosphate N-acetyltransferase